MYMHRTTIMADEDVIRRLRQAARARGVSLGEVVREALAEKASALIPAPLSLGTAHGRGAEPHARDIGDLPIEPDAWRS